MRFLSMRTTLAASTAGLVVAIAGCASNPEPLMPEPELPEQQGAMEVGVNYIEPTSDIVIMDPSYQHVVLPDGARVAYRPGWEDEAIAAVAESLDGNGASDGDQKALTAPTKVGPNSSDVSPAQIPPISLNDLPRAEESDDPVYRAWRKLCEMRPEALTDEEFEIVLTQKMPSELEGFCEEGRQWLAELK